MIVSVLMHKRIFTKKKAIMWLTKYKLKTDQFSETENYYHFTQQKPTKKMKLRTIKARPGVLFVVQIKPKLIRAGFALSLPADVQSTLDQYGSHLITQGFVCRAPLNQTIETVANVFSLGKFNEAKKKMNYDTFFHLWLQLKLDDGTDFWIEKNQVFAMGTGVKQNASASMEIPKLKNSKITLSDFFNNAVNKFGSDFIFRYDMEDQNCQRAVTALLVANGLDNPSLRSFTNQHVKGAITNDVIRKGAKVAVKLAEGMSMILGFARDKAKKIFNIV